MNMQISTTLEDIETDKTKKCCVPGCDDTTSKRHKFPINDTDRFNKWVKAIRTPCLENLTLQNIYKSYYVCSRHFSEDQIVPGVKGLLRHGAVPNLFLKEHICRLCLKKCDDFEVIEERQHAALSLFSLTLNLGISIEPVMCKICAESLQKSSIFKTASLFVRDHLMAVYGQSVNPAEVCLVCKRILMFGSFVFLNSTAMDILLLKAMMEQYFPELDLPNITNPIICSTCYECLQKNFNLIINCLSVEEKIKKYCEEEGTSSSGQVDLKNVLKFTEQATIVQTACECIKIEDNQCVDPMQTNNNGDYILNASVEKEVIESAIKIEDLREKEEVYDVDEKVEIEERYIYEEMDSKVLSEHIKIEEAWKEEESEVTDKNLNKTVDTVSEIIEDVVRKWGYCENKTLAVDSSEEDSDEDDFSDEDWSSSEELVSAGPKATKPNGREVTQDHKEDTRYETCQGQEKKKCWRRGRRWVRITDGENSLSTRIEHKAIENPIKIEDLHEEEEENDVGEKVETEEKYLEGMDSEVLNEHIKTEEVWKEEEVELTDTNLHKTVDTVSEIIEDVVRKWGYCEDKTLAVVFSEEDLEEDDFSDDGWSSSEEPASVRPKVAKRCGRGVTRDHNEDTRDETCQIKGKRKFSRTHWIRITDVENSLLRTYIPKSALRAKITRIEVSGEKKYQCQVCHFVARAKCSMNRHMQLHQDPLETTFYECHSCGFKTRHKFDLRKHIYRKHRP